MMKDKVHPFKLKLLLCMIVLPVGIFSTVPVAANIPPVTNLGLFIHILFVQRVWLAIFYGLAVVLFDWKRPQPPVARIAAFILTSISVGLYYTLSWAAARYFGLLDAAFLAALYGPVPFLAAAVSEMPILMSNKKYAGSGVQTEIKANP